MVGRAIPAHRRGSRRTSPRSISAIAAPGRPHPRRDPRLLPQRRAQPRLDRRADPTAPSEPPTTCCWRQGRRWRRSRTAFWGSASTRRRCSPRFPGYAAFGIRVGASVRPAPAIVDAENLTDKNYRGMSWGVDAPGRGVSARCSGGSRRRRSDVHGTIAGRSVRRTTRAAGRHPVAQSVATLGPRASEHLNRSPPSPFQLLPEHLEIASAWRPDQPQRARRRGGSR